MAVVYSIRDWDEHFEKSQSRRDGSHRWVAMPTKHDGKGFRRIMLRPDGPMIYGAWVLIVQVAAKCPKRGVLEDADGPLTPDDLAIKTGAPPSLFQTALNVLCSKEIGWMSSKELVAVSELAPSLLPLQDSTNKQDITNITKPKSTAHAIASRSEDAGRPADDGDDVDFQGDFSRGWAAAKAKLSSMGATRWREAIDDAKGNGCTPGHVMELLAFAQKNAMPVGSVVYRVTRASMTLPVSEGWPPKPPDQAAASERKRSRESADEQAHQERAAKSQATAAERERRFGPELDAMEPAEVSDICKPNPAMAKLFRKGEKSPLLREWLLLQLERRVTS